MVSKPRVIRARNGAKLAVHRLTAADIPRLQRFNAELSGRTRSFFLPHAYDDATLARHVERSRRGLDRAYVLDDGGVIAGYFFLWEFDQPVPVVGLGLLDVW